MFLKPPLTLTHIDGIFSSNITSCVLGSSSFRKRSWLTMFFLVLGGRTRTLSVIHTSTPSSVSMLAPGVSPPRKKGFFRISSSGCDSRYCILSSIAQMSCSEKKKGRRTVASVRPCANLSCPTLYRHGVVVVNEERRVVGLAAVLYAGVLSRACEGESRNRA